MLHAYDATISDVTLSYSDTRGAALGRTAARGACPPASISTLHRCQPSMSRPSPSATTGSAAQDAGSSAIRGAPSWIT